MLVSSSERDGSCQPSPGTLWEEKWGGRVCVCTKIEQVCVIACVFAFPAVCVVVVGLFDRELGQLRIDAQTYW